MFSSRTELQKDTIEFKWYNYNQITFEVMSYTTIPTWAPR